MSGVRSVLRAADPLVSHHRIGGIPVLPAAAQIDAMLSACDAHRPDCWWTVEQVAFRVPLLVVGDEAELEVDTAEDGGCAVRSVRPEDGVPVVHSTARVSGSPLPPPRYVDVAALRAGCAEQVPLSDVAAWREASGIAYGPAYQVIRSAHRGSGRMLLMLRAGDDTNATSAPPFVPPALLDSVFQALGLLDGGAAGACLPWYVGRVVARRRISGTVIALVERDEPGGAGGRGGAVRGRATLCNQQGEVLLELDRVTLKAAKPVVSAVSEAPAVPAVSAVSEAPAASAAPAASTAMVAPTRTPADSEQRPPAVPLIETVVWRKADIAPVHPAAPEGPVLIVSTHDLRPPAGRHGVHVTPSELSDGGLDTLPADAAFRDVVYVAPRGPSGEARVTEALQEVFALVRRLAARPPMPDLMIVTSSAHQVAAEDVVDPFMTALWGLGRTLRVEHPRTRVRLVDLGPDSAAGAEDGDAAVLWDALGQDRPELARRDDAWYEPSVRPQHTSTTDPARYDGGRFLITGGMGGIGLCVAEFLADAGCARLTLVGRTVPKRGEARERLDRLGARCDLTVVAADVRSLREELAGAGRYDGVFHAAGVLRDGLARGLTPEQVDTVLGPKIGGVHALTDLLAGHEQPGFVALFSSVAAVRANLGQSAYAAANAYLEGYAARQRAEGRAWYSLGWGLWTVGMGESIAPKAAAHGIPALTQDDGIDLLRTALGRPPAHYVLSAAAEAKDAPMTAVAPESGLWPSLTHALTKVLHLDGVSAEDDLLELGLDSMMAVELAAALSGDGLDIDPMVFFERTDVGALLAHLESLPRTAPATTPAAAPAPPPAPALSPAPAPASVSAPAPVPAPPTPAAPPARASHISPVAPGTADSFVPDWDRFRDAAPAAAAPPVSPPRAPAGVATRAYDPTATRTPLPTPTPTPTPSPFPPPTLLPSPAPAPAAPAADRVPRRTLPGRLADAPHGRFLDRRIDALSTEDRLIVAKDEYFYEPVIEEATGPRIKFDGRWFLNFASYSYLGLIGHDYIDDQVLRAVERHGTGAHGVRLLAGTLHLHRELELALARFLGTEDAIVFSSGYMANVATVGALVGPGDVVIGDVYNHASILDGYRLSGASVITYAHNDLADLERALRKAGDAGRLVVTDAVFSMDGDVAELPGIVELCERYDAPLMVDEAHSLGVLGATGRGITEHFGIDPARVDVKMGTLSKTVPSAGGYVAGSSDLIFALKNNARGWMFSAAATPAQVAAAKAAIEVMAAVPSLTRDLRTRTTRYRERLRALGFDTLASETPVVPIICTSAEQAGAMARQCQQDGLFVQPIVYPAVPRTLPRLRTIVNLSHSEADLDAAVVTLEKAGRACGLIR
ncbi:bifunctional SDR family oxidoreductase/pyridoxal phosphate-dependent aminotransferase family protein [Streptomyces sp. 35G-GA-8]|uniref:bifunctional SDR family oxidoreductase/pyridoxal phosphate-dependent aminotransferase family protein n=1 Tax=Streptomyces sp. 35G-GA-8 TaxID=2939434 RepID=UPI00201FAF5F|nr:bifunctional SDR family oxidoreductase/pyridoxal phosphate-dependent aminotransferase family protein [Streptomyces sp. 35G-GA-8]MCL7382508.1 aminotransferase class I/II-fold pyridoxal phosphate-dependent enzyme [Streptomyces sp. 35G-GA-8]